MRHVSMGTMGLNLRAHGGWLSGLPSRDSDSAGGWETVEGKLRSE